MEVTCAIILHNEKILVTQRSEKMKLPLKWEFPGGKIEANESPEDCLIREIKEELNLDIELIMKLGKFPYDYGTFQITLIPFIANFLSGEIFLAEHKDYKWLPKDELLSLDWAAADIPVLKYLLTYNYDSARPL